jgi:hypothetical protein
MISIAKKPDETLFKQLICDNILVIANTNAFNRVSSQITFSVMPDLIRHPEDLESPGFRLSPE